MSKEAMKLALEALEKADAIIYSEYCGTDFEELQICEPAIKALEEALANHIPDATKMVKQEQGEPVAWVDIDENGAMSSLRYWSEPDNRHEVALYTTPQQRTWIGLTSEDYNEIFEKARTGEHAVQLAEIKLREKNFD